MREGRPGGLLLISWLAAKAWYAESVPRVSHCDTSEWPDLELTHCPGLNGLRFISMLAYDRPIAVCWCVGARVPGRAGRAHGGTDHTRVIDRQRFERRVDPRLCFRLYFAWDEASRQVVMGHLPGHMKT